MPNNQASSHEQTLLISYLTLRKWVGFLGILLSFVLMTGSRIFDQCTQYQPSISHYYYSIMGNYFVGTLCAVALFLFSYKGYDRIDNITGNLAAVFAILVAFFPTDADSNSLCQFIRTSRKGSVNYIHYTSAALLFSSFAFFSLFLFTKSSDKKAKTSRKKIRNRLYIICGIIILACIILLGAYHLFENSLPGLEKYKPVLVLESSALIAFGTSWIIKGESLLKDK